MDVDKAVTYGFYAVLGIAVLLTLWNWLRAWRTKKRDDKIRRLP